MTNNISRISIKETPKAKYSSQVPKSNKSEMHTIDTNISNSAPVHVLRAEQLDVNPNVNAIKNIFLDNDLEIDLGYVDFDKTRFNDNGIPYAVYFHDGSRLAFDENGKISSLNIKNTALLDFNNDDSTLDYVSLFYEFFNDDHTQSTSIYKNVENEYLEHFNGKFKGFHINEKGESIVTFSDGKWLKIGNEYSENPDTTELSVSGEQFTKSLQGKIYEINFYPEDGIFSEENARNGVYGGNQMAFDDEGGKNELLLDDPVIYELVDRMGADNIDPALYPKHLDCLCESGCGYVAWSNAIFTQYYGKEEEFYDKFGFPMYTTDANGNKNYNYEYMELLVFDSKYSLAYTVLGDRDARTFALRDSTSIESLPGDRNDTNMVVSVPFDCEGKHFNLSYHSIEEKFEIISSCNINGKLSSEMVDLVSNNPTIIGSYGFELCDMDGEDSYIVTYYPDEKNWYGHDMLLTGVTGDGDYIVSTWGEKKILKPLYASSYPQMDIDAEPIFQYQVMDFNGSRDIITETTETSSHTHYVDHSFLLDMIGEE